VDHSELKNLLLLQKHLPISPISVADYSLYRMFFNQDDRDAAYANTFTYITQACRAFGLGIKYVAGDLLYSIGAYRGHYVVVRPIGALDRGFVDMLDQLQTLSGKPVFIKKLFPDQTVALERYSGFSLAMTVESGVPQPGRYVWDQYAYADDDTYPELIYDAEVLVNHDLRIDHWGEIFSARRAGLRAEELKSFKHKMKNLNRAVYNLEKKWGKPYITRYTEDQATSVLKFLSAYFDGREEHFHAHLNVFTPPPDALESDYFNLISYIGIDNLPVAYHVGERIGADAVSFCIGVASKEIRLLAATIYLNLFEYLKPYAIRRVNIGGSETKSLHEFKRTPAPVEERYMAMVVYGVS